MNNKPNKYDVIFNGFAAGACAMFTVVMIGGGDLFNTVIGAILTAANIAFALDKADRIDKYLKGMPTMPLGECVIVHENYAPVLPSDLEEALREWRKDA